MFNNYQDFNMPENTTIYQDRLELLRKEIQNYNLDGYMLPRTDEFQGEFLAPYAERLKWLTGFTGSAGLAIILFDKAIVMSDGRYSLQLKDQVDSNLYDIGNSTKITTGEWLSQYADSGAVIGYDPWLYTPKQILDIKDRLKDKGIKLKQVDSNLIDLIWSDQPSRPCEPISLFPNSIAGKTSEEKCGYIARQVKDNECDACLITAGDSICWLLNVRGRDIDFSPLCLSYAILYADGSLDWFIEGQKPSDDIINHIGSGVRIFNFDKIEERISLLKDTSIWADNKSTPQWFMSVFEENNVNSFDEEDPCILPKAIKTPSEQDAIRKAHIADGVAIVKFLKWIDDNQNKIEVSELSAEQALENFRRESGDYLGASFSTIAGFNDNGAIIHYRATNKTNKLIKGDGLLLVDSGGQYRWGTTDITRTIAIGNPSREMRENYTRVLKGHIAVSKAIFSKDAKGKDIDILARKSLQEVGLDYAHGTGHGVGCYLCVHEAATHISPKEEKIFKAGMLVSNEPGYYKEGEYGIRIENLVLVCESKEQKHYSFETITLAPYDRRLIVLEMLDNHEKEWLAGYYSGVSRIIFPHLSEDDKSWLSIQMDLPIL